MIDQLIPVPFYEDTMVLVDHEGTPFVAMKPIAENMGLAWQVQSRKLNDKFASVITIMVTTGVDGKQYEMVCLPLRKLPAWLYSINRSKVKPELREKIARYQDECDDALWNYWTQGAATHRNSRTATIPQMLATGREIRKLLQELKRETNPAVRRILYAQLEQHCRMAAIPVPALADIGHDETADHESPLLEEFWEVVDNLERAGHVLNHARNPDVLALNLPQVRRAAVDARLALPESLTLRRLLRACRDPRFVAVKAVNSVIESGTVKCWVFDRQPSLID